MVAAIDISEVANKVYRHNFPNVNHISGNICGLTAEKINKLNINAIFMSPPCQPFTRQGKQNDLKDPRTEPLVHIINLLPTLQNLRYILVENVKGFDTSEACKQLVGTLRLLSFDTNAVLMSPTELGIPNSRLRCYIIAKKSPQNLGNIVEETYSTLNIVSGLRKFNIAPVISEAFRPGGDPCKLEKYLEHDVEGQPLVPDNVLRKHGEILDIVNCSSSNSCCFTKSYGRYAEGTGSVIQQNGDIHSIFSRAKLFERESNDYLNTLRELKLRYMMPYEIASLLGFPVKGHVTQTNDRVAYQFEFPSEYLDKPLPVQCYRVLGNSLNVTVVSFLTCILLTS